MTKTSTKKVMPSELIRAMVNMGYNETLSAPVIAYTYLSHVYQGTNLPSGWEKETLADVKCCFNKLAMTEAQQVYRSGRA